MMKIFHWFYNVVRKYTILSQITPKGYIIFTTMCYLGLSTAPLIYSGGFGDDFPLSFLAYEVVILPLTMGFFLFLTWNLVMGKRVFTNIPTDSRDAWVVHNAKELQNQWIPEMDKYIGKRGTVIRSYPEGAIVEFEKGERFMLKWKCIDLHPEPAHMYKMRRRRRR